MRAEHSRWQRLPQFCWLQNVGHHLRSGDRGDVGMVGDGSVERNGAGECGEGFVLSPGPGKGAREREVGGGTTASFPTFLQSRELPGSGFGHYLHC